MAAAAAAEGGGGGGGRREEAEELAEKDLFAALKERSSFLDHFDKRRKKQGGKGTPEIKGIKLMGSY